MQNDCPNCHGQLFVLIDSGWHCWSKFPIIRVMWRRSMLFVELPASHNWALSFAGTWTLLLRASSSNLRNSCQRCLRTSRYLDYLKAWANMAPRNIWFCQQGICLFFFFLSRKWIKPQERSKTLLSIQNFGSILHQLAAEVVTAHVVWKLAKWMWADISFL